MISFLQVENLSKRFGEQLLFENITFGIGKNQKVALIAKNGMGKSTLLRIIAGKDSADTGTVIFRNDISIGILDQDPELDPENYVFEEVFNSENPTLKLIKTYEQAVKDNDTSALEELIPQMDALAAWDYDTQVKQILSELKVDKYSLRIKELSGGQRKRVGLAKILISNPDFLILDEPTNHLDVEMTEWLEEFLRRTNITLLMVTHDRYFLDRVCNQIVEIDNHTLYNYNGNYSYYLEKREERIEIHNAEIDRARNLMRTELDWIRRQPQARGTKAKYRVDAFYELQAKARQEKSDGQVRLEVKSSYIGSKIFEAKGICKTFGDLKIIENFDYTFARYEKMGIVGNNGTGKSTFIKMLVGEIQPDRGRFDIGETVKFGYYSQDGLHFNEQMKVIDAVRDIAEEISLGDGRKLSASQFLQHFLFTPETQHSYIYKLSGGERRRLYLCTILISNPNFLVLDEPTNDLDIVTLNVLEDYLRNFKGCLIVISHDRYFMDKVVDHLLVFKGNGELKDFPGNYTDYREWKETQEQKAKSEQAEKAKQDNKKTTAEKRNTSDNTRRRLSFKEKKELEQLEMEIAALEEEKKTIETNLCSGTLSIEELTLQSKRLPGINENLDEKTLRWLELSEIEG